MSNFELLDNKNINLNSIIGPNWTIKLPSLEQIDEYNQSMIKKRENHEIRQLVRKKCQITGISFYGSNNKGKFFPLIECYTKCNYCGKQIKLKYLDINKIRNKEQIVSYCNLECSNKANIQKMQKYWIEHPEENCKGFKRLKEENPQKVLEISRNNCKKMNEFLDKNPEIRKENIQKLQEGSRKWREENGFSSFKENNNILYYYDRSIHNYTPWNDYKKKFKIDSININISEKFKLYPTFRVQNSEDWSGASNAFEQSLVDEKIGWFIYIKFYISNNGVSIPLVCGKSGSLLVNSRGSDVSFSTNIDDGPARRFLVEENLQWDKTKVAILKCESENEAYKQEKYYLEKLNLFGS